MQNHYETLGLERSAQQPQIKKAFHRLALRWHPDKNREDGATNQFTQINEAYKTLSKAETKQKYDRKLQTRDDMQNLQNLISQYNEAEDFMTKEDRDFLNEFTRKCQDNEIKNKKIRKKK